MRSRNHMVRFFLNEKEHEALMNKVVKSGLSVSVYMRKLIKGQIPKDLPPPDYFAMMRELYRIGNCLVQIVDVANAYGIVDREEYERQVQEYRNVVRKITEVVIAPDTVR